jgi:hypothetical protein
VHNDYIHETQPENMYLANAMIVVDFIDGVIPNRNLFKKNTGNLTNMVYTYIYHIDVYICLYIYI